jgi:hypothetical protein
VTTDELQPVIALYVEGGPEAVCEAAGIAARAGMVIALTTPDSLIAVAPALELATVKPQLDLLASTGARIAVGPTQASISGTIVDGPALDVEGWAPYPLAVGVWIAPSITG